MPAEEDFESLSAMADRLQLEGEDRENYIGQHMVKFGHKPVTSWVDAEPEPKEQANSFSPFRQSQSQRQKRDVPPKASGGQY